MILVVMLAGVLKLADIKLNKKDTSCEESTSIRDALIAELHDYGTWLFVNFMHRQDFLAGQYCEHQHEPQRSQHDCALLSCAAIVCKDLFC